MFVSSASAQQSGAAGAAAPAPSDAARRAIWCGAAFDVEGQRLAKAGDVAGAKTQADKAAAAFARAATELIPEGMSVEQFQALAERIAEEVTMPFADRTYSEAECEAAIAAP